MRNSRADSGVSPFKSKRKQLYKSMAYDENGQDALQLSEAFNQKVLVIKSQLFEEGHPFCVLSKQFALILIFNFLFIQV